MCKFMNYHEDETYYPYVYCKIDDNLCPYSKKCSKVEKFIMNGDLYKQCPKRIEEERKCIPKDAFYIQTYRENKKGGLYLYIVIDNKVERISTELKEIDQQYVYLKKTRSGYKVSLVPFPKRQVKEKKKEND